MKEKGRKRIGFEISRGKASGFKSTGHEREWFGI